MQMYPGWSARDNYATHTKKKKLKSPNHQHPQPHPTSSSPSQHGFQSQSRDLADVTSNGDCGISFVFYVYNA